MPKPSLILPFHGIRYKQTDLSQLICPPYDIISPAQQQELYARHPNNMVRLEFSLPKGTQDNYQAAASDWQAWRQEGVLVEDEASFYLLKADFEFQGKPTSRLGLFIALHLESLQDGRVLPHEKTRPAAKADRLALMQATNANFSPIWTVCHKPALSELLQEFCATPPDGRAQADSGIDYSLWRISDQAAIEKISRAIGEGPISIADGHHRYETALTFARQNTADSPDAPVNYVLSFLVEANDPGLVILPTHRAVGNLTPEQLDLLAKRLAERCEVRQLSSLEELLDQAHSTERSFGIYSEEGGCRLFILNEASAQECSTLAPVSMLYSCILEDILSGSEKFGFFKEAPAAKDAVDTGEFQAAFFMRALRNEEFVQAAQSRTRLPEKSTYFWPKIPTGLVMRSLELE